MSVDPVMIMKKRAAIAAAPKIMHLNVQQGRAMDLWDAVPFLKHQGGKHHDGKKHEGPAEPRYNKDENHDCSVWDQLYVNGLQVANKFLFKLLDGTVDDFYASHDDCWRNSSGRKSVQGSILAMAPISLVMIYMSLD